MSSKDRKSGGGTGGGGASLSCKIYIGGLGNGADSKEIESACEQFGRVQSVWVARNPPGFAFVAYDNPRDADDAVRCLDGTKLNGKRVRVEKSSGESRWEKWNLSPPVSLSRDGKQGVTLEYKEIREAILTRKQLQLPTRSCGNGHNSRSSSRSSRSGDRRRTNSSGSDNGTEILKLTDRGKQREKFIRERQSLERNRSEGRERRERSRKRTRKRHPKRSYGSTSSRSSSPRTTTGCSSSERHLRSRPPRSRSRRQRRSRTPRTNRSKTETERVLSVVNRVREPQLNDVTQAPRLQRTAIEMVHAQTQTDSICRQTIGIQCQMQTEAQSMTGKAEPEIPMETVESSGDDQQRTTNDLERKLADNKVESSDQLNASSSQ